MKRPKASRQLGSSQQTAIATGPTEIRKIDRRITRTRTALTDALIEVWSDCGYERLSVRALTLRADIGYATFYRHYKNLEDCLLAVINEAVAELTASIGQEGTIMDEMVALFGYVREHQRLFRAYIALPIAHPARDVLTDQLAVFLLIRYEARHPKRVPLAITVNHWVVSTWQMLGFYLRRMDDYAAAQIAVAHVELTLKALESTTLALRRDWLRQRPGYATERDYPINQPAFDSPDAASMAAEIDG